MSNVPKIPSNRTKFVLGSFVLDLGLILSLTTLWVGIFAPVMTFQKLVFFKETYSIFSGLTSLFSSSEYFLFLILLTFSVLFPTVKILMLVHLHHSNSWSPEQKARWLHILSSFSKWSMLEVYVVAMLVVILRLGILGKVMVRWGLYLFAASVLFSTSISLLMQKSRRYSSQS